MAKYLDNTIYFSSGRVALYNGIKLINLNKKKIILLPDIICKEILIPLKKLKIKYKFYELDNELKPKWSELSKIKLKNISSILMIHYFGFPSDINKFRAFTKKNKITLIEDYCHGYDGYYKSKKLGTFGDICIMSPKKLINDLYSGGILKLNKDFELKKINLKKKKIYFFQKIFKVFKNLSIFQYIKTFIKNKIINSQILINTENQFDNKLIDDLSMKMLKEKKYNLKNRIYKYKALYSFLKKNNINPIYKLNIKDRIIPWHIPFYLEKDEILSFKEKTEKLNLNLVQWPEIPNEFKKENKMQNKYSRLHCLIIK